ncbi:MAG TPA: hypothetical protein VFG47_16340, partial [Geminicoccaceae bacterium]|nr:hypothetical protein [Geminicoccaceae bacterium]
MKTGNALKPTRAAVVRAVPERAAARQVSVLLPLPLDRPFDYRAPVGPDPAQSPPPPGSFVEVPFGSREVVGVVWDTAPARRLPAARLKDVQRRLDAPPMPPGLRRLIDHVAATTLAPWGAALRLALAVPAALEPPVPRTGYLAAGHDGPGQDAARLTPARRRVLAALVDPAGVPRAAAELARAAGVGAAVVQGMARAGLLRAFALPE